MGYSIVIGRIAIKADEQVQEKADFRFEYFDSHHFGFRLEILPCEGEEPKGLTSKEYTIEQGQPLRSPSYIGWGEFMRCCPPLINLRQIITPRGSDGECFILNHPAVKECIDATEALIPSLSPSNQDRAKWLCFWVREAVRRYGNEAAIGFW